VLAITLVSFVQAFLTLLSEMPVNGSMELGNITYVEIRLRETMESDPENISLGQISIKPAQSRTLKFKGTKNVLKR